MTDGPKIVIIGGGLIGLSSADSLAAKGARVTIIERESAPMHGASFSNSGMVHPSQATPWTVVPDSMAAAKAVLDLARRSAPLIAAKARALSLPMTERPQGCLQMFRDRQSWEAAQARYEALGVHYRRQPIGGVLGDRPALFFPNDFSGNAFDYGTALSRDLRTRGVTFMTDNSAALIIDQGRVTGARVGTNTLTADHIVLTAGAQTGPLAASAGLRLPIESRAGFAVSYKKPDTLALPPVPVMDMASRSALTVFEDTLRLSGTMGEASEAALLATWAGLIPDLQQHLGEPTAPVWRGDRPMSLNGKPLIGRTSVPGLWVNAGHGPMGWTLCAGSGALLADMMIDGASDSRFSASPAL